MLRLSAVLSLTTLGIAIFLELVLNASNLAVSTYSRKIDIESPTILASKLDLIANYEQVAAEDEFKTIVLIGDSLFFGRTMLDYGDERWKTHTIEALLNEKYSSSKIQIIDISMDGLLPTEALKLSKLAISNGADGIITNISLRSVSADFNAPNDFDRPWVKDFSDNDLLVSSVPDHDSFIHKFSQDVADWLSNHSTLYKFLQYLRGYWYGGSLSSFAKSQFKAHLSISDNDEKPRDLNPFILLQAKKRYASSTFDMNNSDQAKAVEQIADLSDSVPVLFVYSQIRPDKKTLVVDEEREQREKSLLRTVVARPNSKIISEIDGLDSDHFLDLVHVDSMGYELYTAAISKAIEAW